LLLTVERIGLSRWLDAAPRLMAQLYTLVAVLVGWVFFRAESWTQAWTYLAGMLPSNQAPISSEFVQLTCSNLEFPLVFSLAFLSLTRFEVPQLQARAWHTVAAQMAGVLLIVTWAVGTLATGTFNPFIYFRF